MRTRYSLRYLCGEKIIPLMFFLVAMPDVNLFGLSLTFYALLINIWLFRDEPVSFGPVQIRLWRIYVVIIFSLLLSIFFQEEKWLSRSLFATYKLLFQYIYWMLTPLLVARHLKNVDIMSVGKAVTIGLIINVVNYFLLFDAGDSISTQNGLAFQLIVLWPLVYYFVLKRFGFISGVFVIFATILILLYNTSRSGALIVVLQSLVVLLTSIGSIRTKALALVTMLSCFIWLPNSGYISMEGSPIQDAVAEVVAPYNEELGDLLANPELILTQDKSWLARKLMVSKGLILFTQNPLTGVGLGNFKYVWADLELSEKNIASIESYNNKSSHNSYVQWLAETGLIGSVSLVIYIIVISVIFFKAILFRRVLNIDVALGVSVLGSLIYFYSISAITGLLFWWLSSLFIQFSYENTAHY